MSKIYYESSGEPLVRGVDAQVTDQRPFPVQVAFRPEGQNDFEPVAEGHGLPVQIISNSPRVPIGPAQFGLSVTSSAVVVLSVPAKARCGEAYVRTAAVVFTRDGTNPTATKGFQADTGDIILLNSQAELESFRVIAVSTTASLDQEYFSKVGE